MVTRVELHKGITMFTLPIWIEEIEELCYISHLVLITFDVLTIYSRNFQEDANYWYFLWNV